jgi:hypothetical protein
MRQQHAACVMQQTASGVQGVSAACAGLRLFCRRCLSSTAACVLNELLLSAGMYLFLLVRLLNPLLVCNDSFGSTGQ